MKRIFCLYILLIGVSQIIFAGNWEKDYTRDAFGDKMYSEPVYITEVPGTTDLMLPNLSSRLGIIVKKGPNFPVIRLVLSIENQQKKFFQDNKVYVKLSNGKKFNIPIMYDDEGTIWLGTNPDECLKVLDILNKGNFTMVISSKGDFDTMRCVFNVYSQTTGIKNL